ncbi:baculoviral IAP repeat-containing protein 7-like [Haliotis rufescens]|uniref:baculoviral IAP repeat-containing protein 7-like n=1 Tax=Haliotis rufescens TaxID=6454 RepID=UPI00201FA99E|nr:baculoviral IAP repeat-containing protein 7-like [Haliotis rufescens]
MAETNNRTDACEGTRTLLVTEDVDSCGPRRDGTDSCGPRFESTDSCDGRPPLPSELPSPHQHFERRLASFEAWPMQMNQTAEEMAHADFEYTLSTDSVCCFQYGVRLRRWAPLDDPWVEHLKWSPQCTYLKMTGVASHKKDMAATFFLALCVRECESVQRE